MSLNGLANIKLSAEDQKAFPEEYINQLTKSYLNSDEDFNILWWKVKKCEDVVGFQGEYYKMSLDVSLQGKLKRLAFFIKSLPEDKEKRRKLMEVGYFNREFCVYKNIFPMFEKVQNPSKYYPRCGLSSNTTIILEDMHEKGYRVVDSRETFDLQHCLVSLKSLAKFHAASVILEEKSREADRDFQMQKEFSNFLNECGYKYEGWYAAGTEAAYAAALQSDKYAKTVGENKELWQRLFKTALTMCQPSTDARNVLCHRDLWANNLMFNYDENNLPFNCVFVDYQACRCMPLSGDVVSLVYLNMSKQERDKQFEELILHYFKELSLELEQHNIQIYEFLTWDAYRKDCERYKLWGLVQCMILHQLALLKREDVEDVLSESSYDQLLNVSRSDFVVNILRKDLVYKRRMMESIEEFIQLFFII